MEERPYRKRIFQTVDPKVSKRKFEKELQIFMASGKSNRERGIFLMEAKFPIIYVLFSVPHIFPRAIVFGAKIDFTNYDTDPPSLVFVDPFSLDPIPLQSMATHFPKLLSHNGLPPQIQNLLVGYKGEDIPFFCIEGIREYHYHPAHTGNSWFLHRRTGKGTIGFIVDQIYYHGIKPLSGYNISAQLSGFQFQLSQ